MGVSSSESHDLTAFYEMLSASFGVLSQNTGFYPSLDRIIETTLGPLNLGPGGGSYNEPISRLHQIALLGKPDTLRELVQATVHHDNLYWERQDEHKRTRQQQPPRNTTTRQTRSDQPPDRPNEQHLNPRGRLKDEERRRRRDNNLCLFCGKSDHTIAKCPTASAKGRAAALPTETPLETLASKEPTGPAEPSQLNE